MRLFHFSGDPGIALFTPGLRAELVHRYELPAASFEDLRDVGMWVSRSAVRPLAVQALRRLPHALEPRNVELRFLPTLTPLRNIWSTAMHASGTRLRDAEGRGEPGGPRSA